MIQFNTKELPIKKPNIFVYMYNTWISKNKHYYITKYKNIRECDPEVLVKGWIPSKFIKEVFGKKFIKEIEKKGYMGGMDVVENSKLNEFDAVNYNIKTDWYLTQYFTLKIERLYEEKSKYEKSIDHHKNLNQNIKDLESSNKINEYINEMTEINKKYIKEIHDQIVELEFKYNKIDKMKSLF